jgi:hypothetical protein
VSVTLNQQQGTTAGQQWPFFMTGFQLLHHIVAIVGFVGCSFSYLHPLMGWKDMKEGIFSNWSLWRNISLKTTNDKTDF